MGSLSTEFGKNIRRLRTEQGMSQEEVAFSAGISAAHLGQIERGEKNPTLTTIGKLAAAFDLSLAALFTFETEHTNTKAENSVTTKIDACLSGMTPEEQRDILRIVRIFCHYREKK